MNKMKKILLIALIALTTLTASAQLQVEIGAGKTDLRKNAITIGLSYIKSLDSLYGNMEYFKPGKHSFLLITPQADIRTGTEDAFSSITVKATGLFTTFKTTTVSGLVTPDFNKTFHVFPISIGAETNNLFNNINGLLEVGWIPYYQSYSRSTPDFLRKTNIAFYLQAGYKFKTAASPVIPEGGQVDESLEAPDKSILRLKGSAGINTGAFINVNGFKVGLVGNGDLWYDIANNAFYNRIDARGRFFLSDDHYLDFVYTSGSGSPNFNTGDTYGIGLTLKF